MIARLGHLNLPVRVSTIPLATGGIACSARNMLGSESSGIAMAGAGTYTHLASGHQPSIWWNGYLRGVRMRIKSLTNVTSISVIVCRYTGSTPDDRIYTEVGTSDPLTGLATGYKTYTLAAPIAVQAGDKVGLITVTSGAAETVYVRALGAEAYTLETYAGAFSGGPGAFDSSSAYGLDLVAHCDSPSAAWLGDSTTAGQIDGVGTSYSYLLYSISGAWETVLGTQAWKQGYGYHLTELLPNLFPNGVFYAGVSGQTAAGYLTSYFTHIETARPNVAVLSFGINDAVAAVTVADFIADMEEMALRLASVGSVPILCPAVPSDYLNTTGKKVLWAGYKDALWRLCRARGWPYIDWTRAAMQSQTDPFALHAGVRGTSAPYYHPGAVGYRTMAALVAQGLVAAEVAA